MLDRRECLLLLYAYRSSACSLVRPSGEIGDDGNENAREELARVKKIHDVLFLCMGISACIRCRFEGG